ncbi:hypothetical protein GF360_03805 [candidate division WWE3 bacterium]|nr:hypothetical protein [candidate division WWE3 bacterium]
MKLKLPKGLKILALLTFLLIFVLGGLTFSITTYSFPLSVEQISKLFLKDTPRAAKTNQSPSRDETPSPFSKIQESGDNSNISLFEDSVRVESQIEDFEIEFTPAGKQKFSAYLYTKGFFTENAARYTYSLDEVKTYLQNDSEVPPKYVTPETLTIYLTDDLSSAKIFSGTDVEMGLNFLAQDEDVVLEVSISPAVLQSNEVVAEKIFSGLLYQGVDYLTSDFEVVSSNYSPPEEFFTALNADVGLVDISKNGGLIGFLEGLGVLKRGYAYCSGTPCTTVCECEEGDPYCDTCATGQNPCYYEPSYGGCVDLRAYSCDSWNCHWVNPDPEDPPEDPEDPPNCSCDWTCGDIRDTCHSTCDPRWLPTDPCGGGQGISACLPADGDCGGGGDDCGYSSAPTCGSSSITVTQDGSGVDCVLGSDSTVDIYINNVSNAETVKFPTWTATGGQDDIVRYSASNVGGNTWKATVNLANHPGYGTVHIHAYADNCDDSSQVFCAGTTIQKNDTPSCTAISGSGTVLFGDTELYTSTISDTYNMDYSWSSTPLTCLGSFNPEQASGVSTGQISTSYTAPNFYESSCGFSAPISLEVSDNLSDSSCEASVTCSKNVTLRYPQISGTIFDATVSDTTTCNPAEGETLAYFASSPDLTMTAEVPDPVDPQQNFEFSIDSGTGAYSSNNQSDAFPVGSDVTGMYLELDDLDAPTDTNFQLGCVTPGTLSVGPGLLATGPYTVPGNVTINLGYELTSALDGWFTVVNGGVYSGSAITMITPETPGVYDNYMTDDFALSAGDLSDVESSDSNSAISSAPEYGYASSPLFLAIASGDLSGGEFADISSTEDFSGLDPTMVYSMSASTFEDVLADIGGEGDYSGDIASDGVVVIYIDGDITFEEPFYSGNDNRKILLVVNGGVTFSEELGVDVPAGDASDVTIGASVFALGDINFPSVEFENEEIDDPGDTSLVLEGAFISGGTMNFNRNRTFNDLGELRNMYPGVAVHYDPAYAYYLHKQLMDSVAAGTDFESLFLSLVDISWEVEE